MGPSVNSRSIINGISAALNTLVDNTNKDWPTPCSKPPHTKHNVMSCKLGIIFHFPKKSPINMLKEPVKRRTGNISMCLFCLNVTAKQEKQHAVSSAKRIPSFPSALTSPAIITPIPRPAKIIAKHVALDTFSLRMMKANNAVMKGARAIVNVVFATVVFEKAKT